MEDRDASFWDVFSKSVRPERIHDRKDVTRDSLMGSFILKQTNKHA